MWDDTRRRNLMRSLLMRLPVGAVIVSKLPDGRPKRLRIVDGKQRIETVRAFFSGHLSLPGWWMHPLNLVDSSARARDITVHDLSARGRRQLENMTLPSIEFDPTTEWTRDGVGQWQQRERTETEMLAAEAELFLLVNFGGVPQTLDDRDRAAGLAAG